MLKPTCSASQPGSPTKGPTLRWVARIRETCEVLATHADMGEDRRSYGVPGCRSFSVGNHVIFFRAIQSGIAVARIMDGRRDL